LNAVGIVPAGTATSSFRITWIVSDDRAKDAVRALHQHFIEQQRPLVP
jgi:aspartokinase